MLAAEHRTTTTATTVSPHLHHHRKPLQPKHNIFNFNNNSIHYDIPLKSKQDSRFSLPSSSLINESNKENINPNTNMNTNIDMMNVHPMDASLAEELTAVKRKMERLRSDKDKTRELLQQRDRVLEVQMTELINRGEFQKELEIEVDRLYRLKHLKLACVRMSPIRSLREKEMDKKVKDSQVEQNTSEEKSGEIIEELEYESSTTESPTTMSVSSSPTSTSASTSASVSTAVKSTATSKVLPISLRLLGLEK